MSVLSFDRVTYRYPESSAAALDGVTVDLAAGEFCVVAGMSASGKSTFLRAACGLVPHFHGGEFAGRVTVAGLDTREHGPGDLANVAGTVFQDPETQVVMASVRSELAFPLENRGQGPEAVARGVEEVALALGIERLLDRGTDQLSGGELQRVALGAALAGRPRLVLLDEPTSQLDPVAGDELVWLLRRLNEEWGTTVVLIEHRLERCLGVADRVLALERGGVAWDGDPSGFLDWAAQAAPSLQTPGARLLAGAGLRPAPAGVKQARAVLRTHGLLDESDALPAPMAAPRDARRQRGWRPRPRQDEGIAVRMRGVWHELPAGPATLRGVDLAVAIGERVALMGRNGAGKSTLLRHVKGLLAPTRGSVQTGGPVALLLQHPGDYFLHERVADEASAEALREVGLGGVTERHPGELSGGERQRLALAIAAGTDEPIGPQGRACQVIALDEPTRGMDRAAKEELAERLRMRSVAGSAVIVATHDVEFAASFAERVVLMADGRVIADAPVAQVLCGGWYFATETARILSGEGGALLPDAGAWLLRRRMAVEVVG